MPTAAQQLAPEAGQVQVLRIELTGITPTIWRQVAVPTEIDLETLHQVIQTAMGWNNIHLHAFQLAGDPGASTLCQLAFSEHRKALADALHESGSLRYIYDPTDRWEHLITVENTIPADLCPQIPYCLDGANACPPDDIGGAERYAECLAMLTGRTYLRREDAMGWSGNDGFDPSEFDSVQINRTLKKLALLNGM